MLNNKIIVFTALISVCVSFDNTCMDQPRITIQDYQAQCIKIIEKHKIKTEQYKTITAQENLASEKIRIEGKLNSYKNSLNIEKESLLSSIKNTHNIDEKMWVSCLQTINQIEQFNKINQNNPLPDVLHDAAIPKNSLSLITNYLEKAGINPLRINIYGKTNLSLLYSTQIPMPCLYKASQSPTEEKKEFSPFIISEKNINAGKIVINLDLFESLDMYTRGALCVRIAEDIIQNTTLIPNIIEIFEPLLISKTGTILNSRPFKDLYSFNTSKLTVFLPSLKNPTTAACMLQLQLNCFDHNFSIRDYNMLARIERYWKCLRWIETKMLENN